MPNVFNRIVRCRAGHLYETTWVPLMSLKAVRLGAWRIQFCPVGHHWSIVRLVDESTLTPDEIARARAVRDTRVP